MSALALALLLLATPAFAQSGEQRIFRLGQLALNNASSEFTRAATLPELARLGFVEGRNLIVDARADEGAALANAARDLVRGAAPGELPIEAPATFAFAVNMRTARALALPLPPALLIRADEVIE